MAEPIISEQTAASEHAARNDQPVERTSLVPCALHGLRYDAKLHSGCVVCRRLSGEAPPDPKRKLRPLLASLAVVVLVFIALGLRAVQVRNAQQEVVQVKARPLASGTMSIDQQARLAEEEKAAANRAAYSEDGFPFDRAHDKDSGLKSIARAAALGQDRGMRRLLQAGAPIDELDAGKHSALFYAVENERMDVALWLLRKGANGSLAGTSKESLLQIAAGSGNVDAPLLLQYLLDKGAAADQATLDDALCHAHSSNVRSLVLNGADVNASCADGMPVLLHRVSERAHGSEGHRAVDEGELFVRVLLTLGADPVLAREKLKKCRKSCDFVGLNLVRGAKPVKTAPHLIQDLAGNTALHHAAMQGNARLIEKLIAKGLSASKLSDGGGDLSFPYPDAGTPLHLAAASCHADAVEALIKAGASIHAKDKLGREPKNVVCALPGAGERHAPVATITKLLE